MIQEFKIKNYKSFRDEVTLSFEATKDPTFESTHVVEVANGVIMTHCSIPSLGSAIFLHDKINVIGSRF